MAAEHGEVDAQFYLGRMFEKGLGVPHDHPEAIGWYRKSADQGYAIAQLHLGVMYDTGPAPDRVLSWMWFNIAAANSNGELRSALTAIQDGIAKLMPSQQISEAQRLARECKPKPTK